ncbi:MAG: class I SAM-dependent methyltransferase [Gomphosphaeria aponina SAG 52.96 = DSM 107014]|uniref:Class I SAM-dependent methyltransferase n=1 Tax=Gomphosphaeria aponina SAG 52.96 = DSM 107014 TaxID=1521640 RepID=A0A941GTN0_9CHRO|nr:class I SAM-dependent methyltransferase [Gomphosphaeria aponina SAG 52.96 = DSM 107014]
MNNPKIQELGASAAAIQYHYDQSNDFYRLWLDSTNTYSAAIWQENDTLELAQLRKIDFQINGARAEGKKRVLDVGCGWGATLKRLVENYGVEKCVGLTLSEAQVEWIKSFNEPKIEVKLESWADHCPEESYDAIISIGAFEHFAKPNISPSQKLEIYRTFFQRAHQWLKPGGWMSLQTIVYENLTPAAGSKFIAEEIFPESDLPYLAEIVKATERIFEIVTLQNDRFDYVKTLKAWRARLKENRAEAVNLVGEEVVAKYEKYFGICMIGFHTGNMNLARITMRRIEPAHK